MAIENIILDALHHTRDSFKLKSTNKLYTREVFYRLSAYKQEYYSLQSISHRVDLLKKQRNDTTRVNNIYEKNNILNRIQPDHRVGNCGEYSYIALEYLVEKSKLIWEIYKKPFDITILEIKCPSGIFDHNFVKLSVNFELPLTELFKRHYNSEIWICDLWANIACLSYNYPQEWKNKMLKWHSNGKLLNTPARICHANESEIVQLFDNHINSLKASFNQHVDFTPLSSQ
ncbi:hypothetical protein ID853_15730 [Xenorhabdus sp. Vera]|uniref:hypothetical protein n=1 Tax=Xenorhabdus koppenhoeferi TaxID=351659 RepID=UPI0019AEF4B0|nr:hypothetical protein [Xenorhabdus sp. Vera]MBD2812290.1 hypothetical protein [Xenorhabdus sp. Vera]